MKRTITKNVSSTLFSLPCYIGWASPSRVARGEAVWFCRQHTPYATYAPFL